MTLGSRAGTTFLLKAGGENRIGRGMDGAIVLTDPLCSRVHAVITCTDGSDWQIRDADSRNGTFVNDQKVDEAMLVEGNSIRVGSTEFAFHLSEEMPAGASQVEGNVTQTVLKNQAMDGPDSPGCALAGMGDTARAQELLLLYQLSLKLLGCDDPDDVVRYSLELLVDWTRATVGGFLWISEDGQLKPKMLIPPDAAESVALSKTLTQLVCEQASAVWIA